MRISLPVFFAVLTAGALGCAPQRAFYYPNKTLYVDPETLGISHEVLRFPSRNGKNLVGVWFPCEGRPVGTVVHFHGNYGNVSNHFLLAYFLVRRGFDVLAFDYQGYGASEGQPTPAGMIEDGHAAVALARQRSRNPQAGVAVFGQSIGGAVALGVAAEDPEVRAAVIEATFTSFRAIARAALRRHWWSVPLSWIFPLGVTPHYAPIDYVPRLAGRPLFLIHGTQDEVIPFAMSEALFEKAKEPKTLWLVEGARHLECRRVAGKSYEERIVKFLTDAFQGTAKSGSGGLKKLPGTDFGAPGSRAIARAPTAESLGRTLRQHFRLPVPPRTE